MPNDNDLFDNDVRDVTSEQDRLLLERGYKPSELSQAEKDEILQDLADTGGDDTDNDREANIMPADERDGTDA